MARGKGYTEKEDAVIRNMRDLGNKISEIAKVLNRNSASVSARISVLGLAKYSLIPWTADEDAKLTEMYLSHVPHDEIAKKLDRSVSAIRKRAFDLRLQRDSRRVRIAKRYGLDSTSKNLLSDVEKIVEQQNEIIRQKEIERQAKIESALNTVALASRIDRIDRSFLFAACLAEGATLQQIGDRVGLTRERVRQIVKRTERMVRAS